MLSALPANPLALLLSSPETGVTLPQPKLNFDSILDTINEKLPPETTEETPVEPEEDSAESDSEPDGDAAMNLLLFPETDLLCSLQNLPAPTPHKTSDAPALSDEAVDAGGGDAKAEAAEPDPSGWMKADAEDAPPELPEAPAPHKATEHRGHDIIELDRVGSEPEPQLDAQVEAMEEPPEAHPPPEVVEDGLEIREATPDRMSLRVSDGEDSLEVEIEKVDDGLEVRLVTAPESVEEYAKLQPELERSFSDRGLRLSAYSAQARDNAERQGSQGQDGQGRGGRSGRDGGSSGEAAQEARSGGRLLDVRA